MIKAVCNLLMFDKPDKLGYQFPKNCEITIPENVPVKLRGETIGSACVNRTDSGLECDITISFLENDFEKEADLREEIIDSSIYAGGLYRLNKLHRENETMLVDSMNLLSIRLGYGDIYGDESLKVEVVNDDTN